MSRRQRRHEGGGWKSLGSHALLCTSQVPSDGVGKWPSLSRRQRLLTKTEGMLRKSFGYLDHTGKTNSKTLDGDSNQQSLLLTTNITVGPERMDSHSLSET